jgi:hypothetical protein
MKEIARIGTPDVSAGSYEFCLLFLREMVDPVLDGSGQFPEFVLGELVKKKHLQIRLQQFFDDFDKSLFRHLRIRSKAAIRFRQRK